MPGVVGRPAKRVVNSFRGSLSALTGALFPVHESTAYPVPSLPIPRTLSTGNASGACPWAMACLLNSWPMNWSIEIEEASARPGPPGSWGGSPVASLVAVRIAPKLWCASPLPPNGLPSAQTRMSMPLGKRSFDLCISRGDVISPSVRLPSWPVGQNEFSIVPLPATKKMMRFGNAGPAAKLSSWWSRGKSNADAPVAASTERLEMLRERVMASRPHLALARDARKAGFG